MKMSEALLSFSTLNREQQAAVTHRGSSLLVLAGAGSGKTRVITYRIASLIEEGTKPSTLLGLSFTNKAAREMKERVIELVGQPGRDVHLSTFHSLGLKILRQEYREVGLMQGFTILDEGDQVAAVRDLMRADGYNTKEFDPALILNQIGQFKNKLTRPKSSGNPIESIAARLSSKYAQKLRAMNAVDFDDLIALPVWVLSKSEEAAHRWQNAFNEILVDEYQDTNWAQLQLLKRLSKRKNRVCAVGDDDQSIYGWRGAEASGILKFERFFPGSKVIALTQNYRSTNKILKAANAVIENNRERRVKVLWSELGECEAIVFRTFEHGDEEAEWVGRQIEKMVKVERIPANEITILYRTNAQSRVFEESLNQRRIALKLIGGSRFYDRKEIRDLVAYLKLVQNPYDEASFRRIINFPARGIGDTTVIKLAEHAARHGLSPFRAVEKGVLPDGLNEKKRTALKQFVELIKGLRRQIAQPHFRFGDLVRSLKESLGLADTWLKLEGNPGAAQKRLTNIDELENAMDAYQNRESSPTLEEFLSTVALEPQTKKDDELDEECVTLMTLHSSKGLEFNHVFLVGCEEGFLPHQRGAIKGQQVLISPRDLAEERRLTYVGITRAKRKLTLTAARKRIHRGKMLDRRHSRFIKEIPEMLLDGGYLGHKISATGDALDAIGRAAFAEMSKAIQQNE